MEPKIRLKGFSGEWKNSTFTDTFELLKNNSLSRADLSSTGNVMNIHYGDVLIKYGECVDVHTEVDTFVRDAKVAKKLYQSCPITNGDIIFADAAEDNTVGKCSEVIADAGDKIVSGLHTIACHPKMVFASKYLGYYLNSRSYHDQLLPHIQGTKISSISKRAISQTYISYPEKTEQQALGAYFKNLDSLIQSTTKKIESLKQVKAASLQSMFPQEGETTPRVRFKGFEGAWENVEFSKLYERSMIKNDLSFGSDKIISVANMYYLNSSKEYDDDYLRSYNIMRLGDIAFEGNKSKHFAHGRLVENTIGDGIVSHVFVVMKPISDKYDLNFWKYYINNEDIMGEKLVRCTKSSTMMTDLVIDDFLKESILVPAYDEQVQIGQMLSSLDKQITLQSQRLEKLKQIKSACLDKMFV